MAAQEGSEDCEVPMENPDSASQCVRNVPRFDSVQASGTEALLSPRRLGVSGTGAALSPRRPGASNTRKSNQGSDNLSTRPFLDCGRVAGYVSDNSTVLARSTATGLSAPGPPESTSNFSNDATKQRPDPVRRLGVDASMYCYGVQVQVCDDVHW